MVEIEENIGYNTLAHGKNEYNRGWKLWIIRDPEVEKSM